MALQNGLAEDQVYILRPRPDAGGYEFVVMLQQETFIGHKYMPPKVVGRYYDWVTRHRDAVRNELYTDNHGTFLSGIAPVLRADDSVAGLLQVDHGVDTYLEALKEERERYLMGLGLMVGVQSDCFTVTG